MNGWICPKCQTVYAPDVKRCAPCSPPGLMVPSLDSYPNPPCLRMSGGNDTQCKRCRASAAALGECPYLPWPVQTEG